MLLVRKEQKTQSEEVILEYMITAVCRPTTWLKFRTVTFTVAEHGGVAE